MLFVLNAQGVPSEASWVRLDPAAPDAPAIPDPPPAPPTTPPGTIPGDAVTPATSPSGDSAPATPALRPLSVRIPAPSVAAVGARGLRVSQPIRASIRATATLTVARANGRVVLRRSLP